jgi:hypothetical protein
LAFLRLPSKGAFFQQCISDTDSIPDVVKSIAEKYRAHRNKKSSQLFQGFQKYTQWLHNISEVIDIAVQTQAGIGCPVWSPIKFVLKVCRDLREGEYYI